MDEEDWSPDPSVITHMEQVIQGAVRDERIAVGSRVLTWEDVIREVRAGTPFGRSYYDAYRDVISKRSEPDVY